MVAIRSPRPIRAVQRARLWAIVWTASQAPLAGKRPGDQPVLEGAPEPLYPSLSLWGAGQDEIDVQLLQGPAELRGGASASELLGQALRLLGRALEDAVPVAVQGHWDTVALDGAF